MVVCDLVSNKHQIHAVRTHTFHKTRGSVASALPVRGGGGEGGVLTAIVGGPNLTVVFLTFSVLAQEGGGG